MPNNKRRKIIVLSDGTGNAVGKVWRTNVWRLYEALDLSGDDQVARYDDGVGSSSFLPLAIIGGAFGFGLKRNVLDLYKFISRNYHGHKNIDLYFFGFSRGAFTIRVLAGLILSQGLLPPDTPEEMNRRAKYAYNQYRRQFFSGRQSIWRVIQFLSSVFRSIARHRPVYAKPKDKEIPDIKFIGVWDTVGAYGFPFRGLIEAFDQFVWPIRIPTEILSTKVKKAAHALSLDDERTTFHPILFSEANNKFKEHGRIKQVWFSGVHSNVGGGYPDDSLAQISLKWMMQQAKGLRFKKPPGADHNALKKAQSASDKDGRLYDPRTGFGAFYRYGPRNVDKMSAYGPGYKRFVGTPLIHYSVFNRIKQGGNDYSPISLPTNYKVFTRQNKIVSRQSYKNAESNSDLTRRKNYTRRLESLIFWRTAAYFGFLFTALTLALLPFFATTAPAPIDEADLRWYWRWLLLPLYAIEYFTPSIFDVWPRYFAEYPYILVALSAVLGVFIYQGFKLKNKIGSEFSVVWRGKSKTPKPNLWDKFAQVILKNAPIQAIANFIGGTIMPFLFICLVLWFFVGLTNRVNIYIADGVGGFCTADSIDKKRIVLTRSDLGVSAIVNNFVLPVLGGALTPESIDEALKQAKIHVFTFNANAPCTATGFSLKAGNEYRLNLKIEKPLTAGAATFGLHGLSQTAWGVLAMPFRRSIFYGWYAPIARIGEDGSDEYRLSSGEQVTRRITGHIQKNISARTSGELFFYVNGGILGFPNRYKLFAYGMGAGDIRACVQDVTETRSIPPGGHRQNAQLSIDEQTRIFRHQLIISMVCGSPSTSITAPPSRAN